jgi:hypothetical protein
MFKIIANEIDNIVIKDEDVEVAMKKSPASK